MSNSGNLAKCDMVLAVSENSINKQFNKLWQEDTIKKDWKLLVREIKGQSPVIKIETDSDFDSALTGWQNAQKDLSSLFSEGKFQEFGEKTGDYTKNGALYNYGWSGSIKAPSIIILEKSHQSVLFTIGFSSGTLYYASDTTKEMSIFDLTNVIYAFDVPIGRITIDNDGKHLAPQTHKQIQQTIAEYSLSASDFSIESLFMDFENAKISNFDKMNSKFPEEASSPLQILIEDYFNLVVSKEDNPYILGYALSVKGSDSDKSVFQPSALRFSTSASDKEGYSAFNYLTMVHGDNFPAGADVGIMPHNLLDNTISDIDTVDGVAFIDRNILRDYFKEKIISQIKENCSKPNVRVHLSGIFDQNIHYNWGLTSFQNPTIVENDSGPEVLNFSYSSEASDEAGLGGDMGKMKLKCDFNASVQFKADTIVITQHLVLYLYIRSLQTSNSGNIIDKTITDTYTLNTKDGKLEYDIVSKVLDNSKSPSSGGFLNFFTDIDDLTKDVKNWASKFIKTNLRDIPLSTSKKYFFPADRVFSYHDAKFSDKQNLITTITYK